MLISSVCWLVKIKDKEKKENQRKLAERIIGVLACQSLSIPCLFENTFVRVYMKLDIAKPIGIRARQL